VSIARNAGQAVIRELAEIGRPIPPIRVILAADTSAGSTDQTESLI